MEELTMSLELYKAAVKGDVSIFSYEQCTGGAAATSTSRTSEIDQYFLSCTLEERNSILHVAARYNQNLNFIKKALRRFPSLIGQKNYKGDTALHVSARQGNRDITKFLVTFYSDVETVASGNNGTKPPWWVKNLEGDTPLHAAMKRGKIQAALFLISHDNTLAGSVNNFSETPLHLAAKICNNIGGVAGGFKESRSGLIKHLSIGGNQQDDMLRLVNLLLRKPSYAVSMRDKDGLTPLLKAACCRSCVPFVSLLTHHNPQLVEQRDLDGRTILHLMKIDCYRDGKLYLETPEINAIKDEQDFNGDTPVHLAIKNSEFVKVRILMECSADFTINNNYGISPWNIIQTQKNFAKKMEDETDKAMSGLMEKKMYRAAVEGDVEFLSQHDDIYLISRSTEGNNILHAAFSPESTKSAHFVMNVLKRSPILLCQTNSHGDTPLHLAARDRTFAAHELIISCKDIFQNFLEVSGASLLYCAPWRVRNAEGNTPLHEALLTGNAICARLLILLDDEVASFVNNNNETPLHVCVRYQQIPGPLWENGSLVEMLLPRWSNQICDELDLLLKANISAAFARDRDSLTPILRAAQCNNFEDVKRIFTSCPSSAEICDCNGRTLLHLMPLADNTEALLKINEIKEQIIRRDYEGNTPLHMAIKNHQFNKVKILLKHCSKDHLYAVNSEGEAPIDLIRSQPQVSQEILELLRDMCPMPQSIYGMSEAAMKENVNILVVIAVLFATITFAAGFTVPGGFNGEGIPILISRGAFKVFLISDAYAMCCSMLALFSLIWIMTGKTSESVKLIDLSVFVLQQAFYGTTLAFMAGVYVAVSSEALWTSILVCTFCSGVVLCSLKPLNLLLSRIFCLIHGVFYSIATEYERFRCLSCLCFALLSGSHWK